MTIPQQFITKQARPRHLHTTFVNMGGLQIPSISVFRTVEYCERVFKATVTGKDGKRISSEGNLKKKMIINVYACANILHWIHRLSCLEIMKIMTRNS